MMTGFKQHGTVAATALGTMRRTPQRITITINWALYQQLLDRSEYEGRSLSNLAAHLLETSCQVK